MLSMRFVWHKHSTPAKAVTWWAESTVSSVEDHRGTCNTCCHHPYSSKALPLRQGLPVARAGKHRKEPFRYENVPLPRAVDWRSKGIVGPVKNQHVNGSACGCCWAFATTGVTECIVAMYTGQPIALSEQQLIDCDRAGELQATTTAL